MTYNTIKKHIGTGTRVQFEVPVPYISTTHIYVYVNGTRSNLYKWVSTNIIEFLTPPESGATIIIKRSSSPERNLVEYTTGTTLTENVLQKDTLQKLYLIQELIDRESNSLSLEENLNTWDAKDRLITNVKNPVKNEDATSKGYVDTTLQEQIVKMGAGNVVGPVVSTRDDIPVFMDTKGTRLGDSKISLKDIIRTNSPISPEFGTVPHFTSSTGRSLSPSDINTRNVVTTQTSALNEDLVVLSKEDKQLKFLDKPSYQNMVLTHKTGSVWNYPAVTHIMSVEAQGKTYVSFKNSHILSNTTIDRNSIAGIEIIFGHIRHRGTTRVVNAPHSDIRMMVFSQEPAGTLGNSEEFYIRTWNTSVGNIEDRRKRNWRLIPSKGWPPGTSVSGTLLFYLEFPLKGLSYESELIHRMTDTNGNEVIYKTSSIGLSDTISTLEDIRIQFDTTLTGGSFHVYIRTK